MPCEHEHHDGCPIAAAQKAFHTRIVAQIELARQYLAANRSSDDEKAQLAGVRLGAFAGGRVDASRFERLLSADGTADPELVARVDEACASLEALAERVNDLTKIAVAPRETLRDAVARALREIGHVFGAARTIELVRTGRYDESRHGRYVLGLPYAEWSPAERSVAPSIRIIVPGASLQAAGLAEFLDGGLKLVLKVDGACPPAPLVRLATPGVYVAQVNSRVDLHDFITFEGPGVAAMVPDGVVRFTHDPRRGSHAYQRFEIAERARIPRRAIGGMSAAQQREDLSLLQELSTPPTPAPADSASESAEPDPTDKLASWLLGQAGLTEKPPA